MSLCGRMPGCHWGGYRVVTPLGACPPGVGGETVLGAVRRITADRVTDDQPGLHVHRRGRLVENQQQCAAHDRGGEPDPLRLPARQPSQFLLMPPHVLL